MKLSLLLACAVLSAGCGPSRQAPATAVQSTPEYFKADPATAGSLRGKVTFAGKRPPARKLSMDAEEDCQKLHRIPAVEELVTTGKQGGLANVFVYIKTGLEGKNFAPVQEAVVLDQRGCQFVPRVVALRAGQTLRVKNSDPVSHNIHPMPKHNRDWNQQQPPEAADLQRRFARPEVMIPVKCNVHNWMKTYIGVLDHPFFAVTDASGEFAFDGLPPGDYTLAAWHESLGELTQSVTIRKGDPRTAAFVYR